MFTAIACVLILLDGGLLDRPVTAPAPKVDPTGLFRFNDLLSSTDMTSASHCDCVTALWYLLRVHLACPRMKMVLVGSSRHANTSFLKLTSTIKRCVGEWLLSPTSPTPSSLQRLHMLRPSQSTVKFAL